MDVPHLGWNTGGNYGNSEIENLAKNFYLHNAKKEIHSCQNINFTLEQGQFIGIVGLSGAGKSTILKCIHRTYLASTGKITYQSEAFGEVELTTAPERQILFLRKNEIGYVSQFLNVMPRTTAREHVMNALLERGVDAAEAKEKAEAMSAVLPSAGTFVGFVSQYILRWGTPASEPCPYHGKTAQTDAAGRTHSVFGQ